MTQQTATAWSIESPDGAHSLEIRPDTAEDALPGAAVVEIADSDLGEVYMWLHPTNALQAMTALARIAGCEVAEWWREVFDDGAMPWHGGPLDPEAAKRDGYKVERRFVITTPGEVATRG